jgi:hypothetical protein
LSSIIENIKQFDFFLNILILIKVSSLTAQAYLAIILAKNNKSFFLTTVFVFLRYGDMVPKTAVGKLVGSVCSLSGVLVNIFD